MKENVNFEQSLKISLMENSVRWVNAVVLKWNVDDKNKKLRIKSASILDSFLG